MITKNFEVKICGELGTFSLFTHDPLVDRPISSRIHRESQWEPFMTKVLIDLILTANITRVCDIGANIGWHSVAIGCNLRKLNHKVSINSFEPAAENFKLLHQNITVNQLGTMIKIFKAGLSSSVGMATITRPDNNYGNRKVVEDLSNLDAEKIPLFSIDHLIKTKQIQNPELLKVDVQGMEDEVLEGSRNFFSEKKPVLMFIEVEKKDGCLHKLREYGFSNLYLIDDNNEKIIPLTQIYADEICDIWHRSHFDVLCTNDASFGRLIEQHEDFSEKPHLIFSKGFGSLIYIDKTPHFNVSKNAEIIVKRTAKIDRDYTMTLSIDVKELIFEGKLKVMLNGKTFKVIDGPQILQLEFELISGESSKTVEFQFLDKHPIPAEKKRFRVNRF